MEKKDINSLPQNNNKKLDYKKIGICLVILITVILISFMSFSGNKKERKDNKNIVTADKIEESEVVSDTTEQLEKITKSNPVLKEINNIQEQDNGELNKLIIQQEYELKRMALEIEKERLERLKQRERAPIKLIEQKEVIIEKNIPPKTGFEGLEIPPLPPYPEEDPNMLKAKEKFYSESSVDEFVLNRTLTPALSRYEVKAGTILPLTLETAINTDLSGDITAVVKRDIYDSKTGEILLIPSGSRVLGKYSSSVSFGQERVQAVFNRITLPNQKSINIGSMKAVDKLGASGVTDKVDNKITKVFSSVVMSAILGVGAGAVKNESEDGESWRNNAIDGGGTQAINVGNSYANKLLNVQPSLTIRQGFSIGIFVDKDLILEPYGS